MPSDIAPGEPGSTRRFILPALFVLALFVALWVRRPDGETVRPWKIGEQAFGTSYSVVVVPDPDGSDKAAVESELTAAVAFINAHMSTYHVDSELSKFNASERTEPQPISTALMEVLEASLGVHRASGGAFDVTVGPLVNAWGFGPDMVEVPTEEDLKAARARVGTDKLSLDKAKGTLSKSTAGLYVDLSAIAKGYAVDLLAQAIEKLGHHRYIVEIGGEVAAKGLNAKGHPWSVGIEEPTEGARRVAERLALIDQSAATSGNYRNFKMVDGKTVTHIIDPRTGQPVAHGLGSVTVVHQDCMSADAWATALYVLGEAQGLKVANERGIAALFLALEADGKGVRRETSEAYDALSKRATTP